MKKCTNGSFPSTDRAERVLIGSFATRWPTTQNSRRQLGFKRLRGQLTRRTFSSSWHRLAARTRLIRIIIISVIIVVVVIHILLLLLFLLYTHLLLAPCNCVTCQIITARDWAQNRTVSLVVVARPVIIIIIIIMCEMCSIIIRRRIQIVTINFENIVSFMQFHSLYYRLFLVFFIPNYYFRKIIVNTYSTVCIRSYCRVWHQRFFF